VSVRLFVTRKLGSLTVCPTYDIYSESAWAHERFGTQIIRINSTVYLQAPLRRKLRQQSRG